MKINVKKLFIALKDRIQAKLKYNRMKSISTDFRHMGMAIMAFATVKIFQFDGNLYDFFVLLIILIGGSMLWALGIFLDGE